MTATWARPSARDAASSSSNFRRSPIRRLKRRSRRPARGRPSRAASWIGARRARRSWPCTAICSRCAGAIRRSRSNAPIAWPGPCWANARSPLRFRTDDRGGTGDRLLLLNLGTDLQLSPIPEPLLAPPRGCRWRRLWSSEAIGYGGRGEPALATDDSWLLPGESALVLAPDEEKTA